MAKNPTTEKFPRCPECGGEVRLLARKGRTREYLRGVRLPIPDDFGIPTCMKCGEESMNVEVSEPLDKLLGEHLCSKLRAQVGTLRGRHGVTQQQIEDALGVTRSYLSHLLAGRNEPSPTLVKMLALFVDVPGAFEHAWGRKKSVSVKRTEQRAGWVVWLNYPRPRGAQVYQFAESIAWEAEQREVPKMDYAPISERPSDTHLHIGHA